MRRATPTPDVMRLAFEVFDRLRAAPADRRGPLLDTDETLSDEVRAAARDLLDHDSPTGEFLGLCVDAASVQLTRPLSESLTPTRIGCYRVLRELGRGGFGRVYLAEQDRPARLAAVKVLRTGSSSQDARRLIFEAEALARLDHPAIARVFECGSVSPEDSSPFIAMEYVAGVSLDRHTVGLGFEERCALLERVCEGIDHAHRRGVLHRDLATKNILVDAEGLPRIIDFGLASTAGRDHVTHTMTLAGTVLGTLGFMSPEQLSGDSRAIDTRSDVFSLGVVVYETLTGRHPFLHGTPEIAPAIRAMLESSPVRPSAIDQSLRGDAEAVLLRCVERDPARRYQSAAELARDLAALRQGMPVAARSYSAWERAAVFARRHKTPVLLTAAVAAIVLGSGLGAASSLRRAAEANDAAMNALDAVVTHVIAPLAPRVGTLEDRERLLESIRPDVDRIAWRAEDDARAARIVGAYFAARGDVFLDQLGYHEARPLYQRAVESYDSALRLGDSTIETVHAASIVLVKLGDTMARTGGDGWATYVKALALDERLKSEHPGDLRLLSNLFWSHWRLAGSTFDRYPGGHMERAEQIAQEMSTVNATHWRTLEARALVLTRRGMEAGVAGDTKAAWEQLTQATVNARALLEQDPQAVAFLKTHIDTCVACAGAALEINDEGHAESLLREAGASIARLMPVILDTDNRQHYVEAFHEPQARVSLRRGDWAGAIRHADTVIEGLRVAPIRKLGAQPSMTILRAMRTKAEALERSPDRSGAAAAWDELMESSRVASQSPWATGAVADWLARIAAPSSETEGNDP